MSAHPHHHRTRKPRPKPIVHEGAHRPVNIPTDAKIGDDPDVLAILNDYVQNVSHEDRHIDGYAFGPNPSNDYNHFVRGAKTIAYFWDSSHESTGEYSEMDAAYLLERIHEGQTTWGLGPADAPQ